MFALYRDSPLRRAALAAPVGDPQRYALFGLDELAAAGWKTAHNLELEPGTPARALGAVGSRLASAAGGYGGDFAAVFGSRRGLAATDVVFSTVDTVGIPYVLLRRSRLAARTPFVYVSIGLLDRIARIGGERRRRVYRDAVAAAGAVIAYGHAEGDELRAWLQDTEAPPPVHFVPFGVDTSAFAPSGRSVKIDVVSVGVDPHRDHDLLLRIAAQTPHVSYRLVAGGEERPAAVPPNVRLDAAIPFGAAVAALDEARVVALPVRDNLYSGATTTLLQALALGKPVVVSRTRAIADGYGLRDGETCRLVPPGDAEAFQRAMLDLLADPAAAAELGRRGRAHVEARLSWQRYTASIGEILEAVAALSSTRSAAPRRASRRRR